VSSAKRVHEVSKRTPVRLRSNNKIACYSVESYEFEIKEKALFPVLLCVAV